MNLSIEETGLNQPNLQVNFLGARPFPLLVIDDFLPETIANGVLKEISVFQEFKKSNDYIFAKNKFENRSIEQLGPNGFAIKQLLLSPKMADTLSSMLARRVFVDPDFVGGGLHRGGEGSFLDMHADFSVHPTQRHWVRELNILLYLNKGWLPEYGGHLDLRHSQTGETASIEPIFNRLVVMITKDFTLHGYKKIHFPHGHFRTSIATYAYSHAETDEQVAGLRTTTSWAPEGGGTIKSVVSRFTPHLVEIKQKLIGSNTARKK